MKTILKSVKTFYCMLLFFSVLLSGCSKDEDAVKDIVLCNTFLECNDATKWDKVFLEDGIENAQIYLKFNNSLSNPFEKWSNFTPNNCHYYLQISDHQIDIIENSKDKLIVKIIWREDDWQQDEFEIWTFTKQGESLKLVTQYFQEVITIELNKTTDNLNDLEICAN